MIIAGKKYALAKRANLYNQNRLSFERAIKEFLTHLEAAGRASSTIYSYCSNLKQLRKIIGNVNLLQITDTHLDNAVINISDSSISGIKHSASTMNRIKSTYRSFFNWCFETERIPRNPAISLHMAKTNPRRTVPITMEEIDLLLNTIGKSDDPGAERDKALFATYAFTGVRRSEALALRVMDYDSISSTINLPKVKGNAGKQKPVPIRLAEILEKYIFLLKKSGHSNMRAPMFNGRYPEKPLSPRQAQNRFNKWKKLSQIRCRLTIHSFRAGFATLLYQTTRDLLLVAQAMGHHNIQTTEHYIKRGTGVIRAAIEKTFLKKSAPIFHENPQTNQVLLQYNTEAVLYKIRISRVFFCRK